MAKMASDGASEGIWGCNVVGVAVVVHPWGAGGGASSLEGRRKAPSDARAVGCGISGNTSAGLWWSCCRDGGRQLQ